MNPSSLQDMGYLGAKSGSGVYQTIVALMPPHETYIEPFAGSGAILARKPPAARSIVLDKDPAAVAALQAWAHELAGDVKILEADALEYLARLDVAQLGRVLVYLDPPYIHATRTSAKRYRCELADIDHANLARIVGQLSDAGCAIILSGYPSPHYDDFYAGWSTREFQAMTRGGVRTEKLWFNFEPGAAHWSTFAGRNFTDRQRIKRKAARWAAKFAALPPAERQAVLAALLEAEGGA